MPCYATGSAEGDAMLSAQEARAEATKVTELLCYVLGRIESKGMWDDVFIPVFIPDRLSQGYNDLQAWWEQHKEIDAARRAARAAEQRRMALRKAALSKLTLDERIALGVK